MLHLRSGSGFRQKHAKNEPLHRVDAGARSFESLKILSKTGLAVGADGVSLHETTEQNRRDYCRQPDPKVKPMPHAYTHMTQKAVLALANKE
jgi:hypothetical protein